jgi:tetratricopeptide (TPR) repeat protein
MNMNVNMKYKTTIILFLCICAVITGCLLPPPKPDYTYNPYLDLIKAKEYDEAIEGLKKELVKKADWKAHHYLGICYEKIGRRLKAIEHYSQAVTLSDNYRPCYRLGILYIEMGESAKALAMLRKVAKYNPDFLRGRFYLAQAAFINNRFEESFEHFRYILDKEEYNPGSLAGMGILKYHQGNPYQAVEFLARSIKFAPKWVWGRLQLGMIYMKLGELDKAERHFRVALQNAPKNIHVIYHLALTLEDLQKKDEAEKLFNELLALPDKEGDTNIIKASILIRKQQFLKAEKLLLANLTNERKPFEVYKRLGYIYALTGNQKKGMECYKEALKSQPDSIEVRYHYAVLLKAEGNEKEAEKQFDIILDINPVTSQSYFLQAIIHGRRGDLVKAESMLKTAIELDKFNKRGRELLISLLIRNNKLAEAATVAEEVLAVNPQNKDIKSFLAQVCIKMKNYRRAELILNELINWDNPDIADIKNIQQLYTLYTETNRIREAEQLKARMKELGIPLKQRTDVVF